MSGIFKYRKWIAAASVLTGAVVAILRGLRSKPAFERGYYGPEEGGW